ncbi:hypothetical protein BKA67DRAFT_425739 [Truncatella angustata]|uniref:Uncharacterized protein n=1 Tax=Truncatella angustata TaxID=152316 RepID=A0A9P8UCT0_9PEZI|nr:uncharacterized protein BKA67DRAFT_425739 [Truncatella angustata]KAH6647076.1 hypothetical protein BKA67DRAFT_425739 [Truncatella angustata]
MLSRPGQTRFLLTSIFLSLKTPAKYHLPAGCYQKHRIKPMKQVTKKESGPLSLDRTLVSHLIQCVSISLGFPDAPKRPIQKNSWLWYFGLRYCVCDSSISPGKQKNDVAGPRPDCKNQVVRGESLYGTTCNSKTVLITPSAFQMRVESALFQSCLTICVAP